MSDFQAAMSLEVEAEMDRLEEANGLFAGEVARLRLLVSVAERSGSANRCPWCGAWEDSPHASATATDEECPAFWPDGTVR